MQTETTTSPKVFLTDYASYNEGTQFEFGHWVELDQFSDADEFSDYCKKHFENCDKKRPLGCGAKREEWMFTDFEGFPKNLYSESFNPSDIEKIYDFLSLEEHQIKNFSFLLDQTGDFDFAMERKDEIWMISDDFNNASLWDAFYEVYPDAGKALDMNNNYLTVDIERFKRDEFTSFDWNAHDFLVHDSWNH